jgi:hypothetical protein
MGSDNTAVGTDALANNTTAIDNTAAGFEGPKLVAGLRLFLLPCKWRTEQETEAG